MRPNATTPRVGLLCYGLERPLSGTTRVARQLGEALVRSQECEVTFLTTYPTGPFRQAPFQSRYLPGCRLLPGLMVLGGPLIALAARRLGLDVVHDPVGVSPFTLGRWAGAFRRVTAVHDAIAFRFPQGYPLLNNVLHRRYVPATLHNVDAVIADSQSGRRDIARYLHWAAEKTFVVPLGVDARFRPMHPDVARRVAHRYGLERPFILTVGAQQARKNVSQVVAAFAELRRQLPHHTLAIAGPTQWTHRGVDDAVRAQGIGDSVRRLGYVADEDLPALYSAADVFVFPSLYEGFGLPVVEAMACGTPVVCSDTTSLPEVAGSAALLVDPTNAAALAEAVRRVLLDANLRRELRGQGLARAAEFTWERAARLTVEVYRHVLRE